MQGRQTPQTGWQFTEEGAEASGNLGVELLSEDGVSWTASEYVAHEKNLSWYLIAVSISFLLVVIVYFVTDRSWFSSLMILIGGGIFIATAARPPKELQYSVNNRVLTIGNKDYILNKFKSFSVIDEGPIRSILLIPLERFMPSLTIYYDPNDEQKIIDSLSDSLPYEERQSPLVDKLMRKIRF